MFILFLIYIYIHVLPFKLKIYDQNIRILSKGMYTNDYIIGYGELLLDKLTIQKRHKDKRLHGKIKIEQHKRHKNI